jgi:hypothetical protein
LIATLLVVVLVVLAYFLLHSYGMIPGL